MRTLDPQQWSRRAQYALYRGMADPFYDLSVRVDAADLEARCARSGWSVFAAVLAGLTHAIQQVEPYRMRLRGDAVVVHEVVHPSWVVLASGDRLGFARGRAHPDLGAQLAAIAARTRQVRQDPEVGDAFDHDDTFYASSLAPLDVVAVRGERSGRPDDSVPRFYWGRIVDDRLGFTISAHHALVDGAHAVRLVQALQEALARPLPAREEE